MNGGPDHFGDDPSELREGLSLRSGHLPSRSDLEGARATSSGAAVGGQQLKLQLAELERRERAGATREELAESRLELLINDPALLDQGDRIAYREQISQIPRRSLDAASAEMRKRYIAEAPLVGEVPVKKARVRRRGGGILGDDDAFPEYEIGNIGASFRNAALNLASYLTSSDAELALDLTQTQDIARRALEQNLLGPDLTSEDLIDLLFDEARPNDALTGPDYLSLRDFLLNDNNRDLLLQALKEQQSVATLIEELQESAATGDPAKEKLLRAVLAVSLFYRTLEMPDFYKVVRDAISRYLRFDKSSFHEQAPIAFEFPPPKVLSGNRPPELPNSNSPDSVSDVGIIPPMNLRDGHEGQSSIENLNRANEKLAKDRGAGKLKSSGLIEDSNQTLCPDKRITTDIYVSWHTPEVKEILVAYGLVGPAFYTSFVSNLFDAISHQLELAQAAHDNKAKALTMSLPPPLLG